MNSTSGNSDLQMHVTRVLGEMRTEQLDSNDIYTMFSQPAYWQRLNNRRPCMLIGGRGTGKTMTLRCLSYTGQFALNGSEVSEWPIIGCYWRAESTIVSSFRGRGLLEEDWQSLFGHYLNLQLVSLILGFLEWRSENLGQETELDNEYFELTCVSLNLPLQSGIGDLAAAVRLEIARLRAAINGPSNKLREQNLSALGAPQEYLLRSLQADEKIRGKVFAFCFDEFENFQPYQQRIVNTLLKHAGDSPYTFKIGIRDSARRERATLVADQPLMDPADYSTVDIAKMLKDQDFNDFAMMVCEKRLRRIPGLESTESVVSQLLPALSEEREAELLGGRDEAMKIRNSILGDSACEKEIDFFDQMGVLEQCFVGFWSVAKGSRNIDTLREAMTSETAWKTRYRNYSYASLFAIYTGKRGIKKYYAGWNVFTQLSGGNIRYVLRLVQEAVTLHLYGGQSINAAVSPENQTKAAHEVGDKALRELQGLSTQGGQLTRLTLSLGRIFEVLASQPHGHAPEVNQFRVNRTFASGSLSGLDELLNESVAHGSLVAFDGDKRSPVSGETRSYDYYLHPIFSPFFVYSHRKKRRLNLEASDVIALAGENAKRRIAAILADHDRMGSTILPEQLTIYSEFFNESD